MTYYEDFGYSSVKRTLDLWVKIWAEQGWEPLVLGPDDAKKHPRFQELTDHCMTLPTINERRFDMACFQRWCAFAMRGGVMMDFDVFPLKPFPPFEFHNFTTGAINGDVSLIAGTKENFESIVDTIIKYETRPCDRSGLPSPGRPHVSDMIVLQRNPHLFDTFADWSRRHKVIGWFKVPLCHFTNHQIALKPGQERTDLILEVINNPIDWDQARKEARLR